MGDSDATKLIKELTKGRAWAEQLQCHLNSSSPSSSSSSSNETRESLIRKILKSYEKSLSMLNESNETTIAIQNAAFEIPPHCLNVGDESDESDQETRDAIKRMKEMPKWKQQVRVSPGRELEFPPNDGFSWRKYGQKDILGAKYPRGYYRCTNRRSQGCLATKQVQRSDEDPTVFEITYRGRHTCSQGSNTNRVDVLAPQLPNQESEQAFTEYDYAPLRPQEERPSNLQNSLADTLAQSFSSFQFHSPPSLELQNQALTTQGMMGGSVFMAGHQQPSFNSHTSMMRNYNASASLSGMNPFPGDMNFHNPETAYTSGPSSSTYEYLFGNNNEDQNHALW